MAKLIFLCKAGQVVGDVAEDFDCKALLGMLKLNDQIFITLPGKGVVYLTKEAIDGFLFIPEQTEGLKVDDVIKGRVN